MKHHTPSERLTALKDILEELEAVDEWAHDFVESLLIHVEESSGTYIMSVGQTNKLNEIYEKHIGGSNG